MGANQMSKDLAAFARANRLLKDPAGAARREARRVVSERDGAGQMRERVFIETYDPAADGRAERYAAAALAVSELAAIRSLWGAAGYAGRDRDASMLLHAFAGPGCVLRPGGRPEDAHRMFLGREAALGAAARVIFTPEALAGLHEGLAASDPGGAGEVASPWADGVWCVGPAQDGTDPRLAALRRLGGDLDGVRTVGGRFCGKSPVSVLADWLVGPGRRRLSDGGYPMRSWVGEGVAALMPRMPLPGRAHSTADAAEGWLGR